MAYINGKKTLAVVRNVGASITVDSELSGTSENPVQNKVVTQALGEKLDEKEFSNSPATWVDPATLITEQDANKHRILAGIYCVDENGDQVILPFSMAGGARQDGYPEGTPTDPNGPPLGIPTFVMYNTANQVLCCLATDAKHAVPLGQLQSLLAGKVDKVAATSANGRKVYGTASSGVPYMYPILRTVSEMQTTTGGLLGRADNGKFVVPAPTANDHIANKKYVDDAVAGASGGGSPWTVASDFTNGTVTLTLTAGKIYEVVALGYHPIGDFTPCSTPVFMLDTNSNYVASGTNVQPCFGFTNNYECAVTMNSNTSATLQWVNEIDGTWSGWYIKVLYREASVAT